MLLEFTAMTEAEMLRMIRSIYTEGCRENAQGRHPEAADLTDAILEEEQFFLEFMNKFMPQERNRYYILEENGEWVSALRLTHIDGFYYLEALETSEAHRKNGYAAQLINEVIALLRTRGRVELRSNVSKENSASLAVHKKCGFVIAEENGVNYIDGTQSEYLYGMLYTEA